MLTELTDTLRKKNRRNLEKILNDLQFTITIT